MEKQKEKVRCRIHCKCCNTVTFCDLKDIMSCKGCLTSFRFNPNFSDNLGRVDKLPAGAKEYE